MSLDYSGNRFLLIFPKGRRRGIKFDPRIKNDLLRAYWGLWCSELTTFRIVNSLSLILLSVLVLQNYYFLRNNLAPIIHLLIDLSSLFIFLVLGFLFGKEIIKQKISCTWSGHLNIVNDFLCIDVFSNDYVIVSSWSRLYDSLKRDAEEAFSEYQNNKDDEISSGQIG
jgi:hypothetical protein